MSTVKISKRQLRETLKDDLNQESVDEPNSTSSRKRNVDLSKIVAKSVSPTPYMNKTGTNF